MGFVKVPVELINKSSDLGISDGMLRIIITVLQFARPHKLPYPSSKRVAKICGVSERTVQKRSGALEKLGYLTRTKGGKKPYWDFSGLFKAIGVPNPADENLKLSNTEGSEQKSNEDSFGQSIYRKDIYINKDKDYKEEYKKEIDKDKEIIGPGPIIGVDNTKTDKEVPCFYCGSNKGFHLSPGFSDGRLFCNNCFQSKIEDEGFKYYESVKEHMDPKTRNAYEKYILWTQRNLKS